MSTATPSSMGSLNPSAPDVFVSYSRVDREFVKQLYDALRARQLKVWLDMDAIPPGAPWRAEIATGILNANAFLFVLSPDSIQSPECEKELDYAIAHHKRLVPIVCRTVPHQAVRSELSSLNWIFFRPEDDFDEALQKLLSCLSTDLEDLRIHTRLLVRAEEWHQNGEDGSFLLKGNALDAIETWKIKRQGQAPALTVLQESYIGKSHLKERRQQRIVLGAVTAGLLVVSVMGLIAEVRRREAVTGEIQALTASSEANFASDRKWDALQQSLRAAHKARSAHWAAPEVRSSALAALTQANCWVRQRHILQGHQNWVNSTAFTRDGQLFASAGEDGVRLWSSDGELVRSLEPVESTLSVAFSPDAQYLAASTEGGMISLWQRNGDLVRHFQAGEPAVKVRMVSFSPDGKTLATAHDNSLVRLWHLDGTEIQTLRGHIGPVRAVQFSPDGTLLASAGGRGDHTIRLWRADGILLREIKAHQMAVNAIAFSPDSQYLLSGSIDRTLKIWRRDGALVRTIDALDSVRGVHFSSDGTAIAAALANSTLQLWRFDGTPLAEFTEHTDDATSVTFSPDGRTLASSSNDGTVRFWQWRDTPATKTQPHTDAVIRISMSPNGQYMASVGMDGAIYLWKPDGTLLKPLRSSGDRLNAVQFSPDSRSLAVGSNDTTVQLWSVLGTAPQILSGHTGFVNDLAFSPDGRQIVSGSVDGTIRLWSSEGQPIRSFNARSGAVYTVAFSADGQQLISGGEDEQLKFWQLDGTLIQAVEQPSVAIQIRVNARNQLIAAANEDGTVTLRAFDGELVRTLAKHEAALSEAVFSPDGQTIASVSDDQTIRIWSIDGALINTLKGHSGSVYTAAFQPDGKGLVTGGDGGEMIFWNIETLSLSGMLQQSCNWLRNYLTHNPNAAAGDRKICGVSNSEF